MAGRSPRRTSGASAGSGKAGSPADLTAIGKFGIGFKSVYAYTRTPRIYSAAEHFAIESYVRPVPVAPLPVPSAETLFVFPFDHDTVPAATAVREISAALTALRPVCCCSCGISRACGRRRGAGRVGHLAVGRRGRLAAAGHGVAPSRPPGRGMAGLAPSSARGSRSGAPAGGVEIAFRLEAGRVAGFPLRR